MLLLLSSLAFAAPEPLPGAATAVVPIPDLTDLDLLPDPGQAFPCTLSFQVSGGGTQTSVELEPGCPTGLVDTATRMGSIWRWSTSGNPRTEEAVVSFRVLAEGEALPAPVSKPQALTFLVRPEAVVPMPTPEPASGPKGTTVPAWEMTGVSHPPLPRAALAASVVGGSCLVRLQIAPDGKVASGEVLRCLDVLAAPALKAASRVRFTLAPNAHPPERIDLAVEFAPAR